MIGRVTCVYCKRRVRVANNGETYGHERKETARLCLGSYTAVDLEKVDRPAPKTPPVQVWEDDPPALSWWETDAAWVTGSVALAVTAFVGGWLACWYGVGMPWS
jgi:hypothetical protein